MQIHNHGHSSMQELLASRSVGALLRTKLNVSMVPPPAHLQPVVEVDESSTLQVQLVHDAQVRRCVGDPSVLREQRVVLIRDRERPDLRSAPHVCPVALQHFPLKQWGFSMMIPVVRGN